MDEKLIHGFPPIIDGNTKVMILGTLPGRKSLDAKEYYSNPGNRLWGVVDSLYGSNTKSMTYKDRIDFLLSNRIGLWDVLESGIRVGSGDTTIKDPKANDFREFIGKEQCWRVNHILFNGEKASDFFNDLVRPNVKIRQVVRIHAPLPSTSPANGYFSAEKWKILRDCAEGIVSDSVKEQIITLFKQGNCWTDIRRKLGPESRGLLFSDFLKIIDASSTEKYTRKLMSNRGHLRDKSGWKENRKAALVRDNHQCVICGSTERLNVHHILPFSFWKDNCLNNLITLCYWHHAAAHGWMDMFTFYEYCILADENTEVDYSRKTFDEIKQRLLQDGVPVDPGKNDAAAMKRFKKYSTEYKQYLNLNHREWIFQKRKEKYRQWGDDDQKCASDLTEWLGPEQAKK